MTPDMYPSEILPAGEEFPAEGVTALSFIASVSVPVAEDDNSELPLRQQQNTSRTGSYPSSTLKLGDVVSIKVVDTDDPDDPVWQSNGPQGPIAIRSLPEQN